MWVNLRFLGKLFGAHCPLHQILSDNWTPSQGHIPTLSTQTVFSGHFSPPCSRGKHYTITISALSTNEHDLESAQLALVRFKSLSTASSVRPMHLLYHKSQYKEIHVCMWACMCQWVFVCVCKGSLDRCQRAAACSFPVWRTVGVALPSRHARAPSRMPSPLLQFLQLRNSRKSNWQYIKKKLIYKENGDDCSHTISCFFF